MSKRPGRPPMNLTDEERKQRRRKQRLEFEDRRKAKMTPEEVASVLPVGRPKVFKSAEDRRRKRRIQQKARRDFLRTNSGLAPMTPQELEERHVNCPRELIPERIKLVAMAKRLWGGVIPDKVLDELLPA